MELDLADGTEPARLQVPDDASPANCNIHVLNFSSVLFHKYPITTKIIRKAYNEVEDKVECFTLYIDKHCTTYLHTVPNLIRVQHDT